MANKLTEMSKIRQAIKLYCKGESKMFISNQLELSRNTVKKYISLYQLYGLSFEDMRSKSDAELDVLFSGGSWLSIGYRYDTAKNKAPALSFLLLHLFY